jgi:hypothetical protein
MRLLRLLRLLRLPPIEGRTIFPLVCKRALPSAADTGAV